MIRVEGLSKQFDSSEGRKVAVDGVDFEVAEGEFFTLLGPSGCGKTTTLRCIAGLEKPTAGSISIDNREVYRNRVLVPTHERDLGMVFQSYAVWPHMTVFDNVAFPLTVARDRPSSAEIREAVGDVLHLVGLGDLPNRMATQLSGGQQQRLSLARALVRRPKVLLLDEPLSNLDAALRERMRAELRIIQQRIGITTLFVTHDQVEALSMSDRIAVMKDGQIAQVASPRGIYHEPDSAFVAQFIGGANLLWGTVVEEVSERSCKVETELGVVLGHSPHDLVEGERVMVAVRLEDIRFRRLPEGSSSEAVNAFKGRVGVALFNGSSVDYHVSVGDGHIQARLGSREQFDRGDDVLVEIEHDLVRVLKITDGLEFSEEPALMDRLADSRTDERG